MRIHSIANSPAFGYNKELNEKVNQKLRKAKGNKELANTMLELNKYCMETEDKLRKAEKEKNRVLVDKYDYLLSGIKLIAVNQINARFPELNYRKKELNTYSEELNKRKISNPNHWLYQLTYSMDQSDTFDTILTEITEVTKKAKAEGKSREEIDESIKEALAKQNIEAEIISDNDQAKTPDVEETKPKVNTETSEYVDLFKPGEYSPIGFVSLGGMEDLKEKISDKIIIPLKDPETAKLDEVEYGKKMPRGELLYGPPGCGKTYFAEALAQETGLPMYKLKISKIGSQFVNGSANNLQNAYSYIRQQAKESGKPVIMFIDEAETFAATRDGSGKHAEENKLLGTFLQIMDDARQDNVFIVGATNLINLIDPAVASRFDSKDYIELPKDDTRRTVIKMMLERFTKGQTLANNPDELEKVVKITAGFSNRTLGTLVNEAADIARKDGRRPIIAEDFAKPVKYHTADRIRNEAPFMDKSCAPAIGFSKN